MKKRIIKPEIVKSETPIKNKYVALRTDNIIFKHRDDDNKLYTLDVNYYTIDSPDFVIVIAEKNDKILVVNQYRWSIREFINGFVTGMIEKGESPEKCAIKELKEEAGIETDEVELLGKFNPLAGQNSCAAYVFYTNNFKETEKKLEKFEKFTNLTTEWIPIEKYRQMIKDGKVKDGPALAAWSFLTNKIQ